MKLEKLLCPIHGRKYVPEKNKPAQTVPVASFPEIVGAAVIVIAIAGGAVFGLGKWTGLF